MNTAPLSVMVRRSGIVWLVMALLMTLCRPTVCPAETPTDAERRQIEMLVRAYYRAVADEDVEEVVSLYHWGDSSERDKVIARVEQAFKIADSEFYAVRVSEVDVYPVRRLGLARVGVEYRVKRFDGGDGFSGHLDAAVVLVRGPNGWRIGKVARAADFDLTAAASRFANLSSELEASVPAAPAGVPDPLPTTGKLPKLATQSSPVVQTSPTGGGAAGTGVTTVSAGGGLTFFAIRQKATGQCVVVAGAEGISPGDTVYGAFLEFGRAQESVKANCDGGQPAAAAPATAAGGGEPLTTDRLYEPDEEITRGRWGTVVRIAEDPNLAGATEGGRAVDDGLYAPPGNDGPTEVVYRHDGSKANLRGTASVVDCFSYCGGQGSVNFVIRGDGRELWSSGLVRQNDPGRAFVVDLEGVHEVRLTSTDGGNGTTEDWAAWLDLEVASSSAQPTTRPIFSAPPPSVVTSPILVVPRYGGDESTTGIFFIRLDDGTAVFIDKIKGAPLSFRRRIVNQGVFTALGRTTDRPAKPGEILAGEIRASDGHVKGIFLVDTSTGAVAYLDDPGSASHGAMLRHVNGRPAAAIASDDGNFALIMRRDGSGRTDGAYLFHGTSGQCVYFAHVDDMGPNPIVEFTSELPAMEGKVAAVELQDGSEATPEALLIDGGSGRVYRVGALEHQPTQVTVTRQEVDLFQFFPVTPTTPTPQRFVLIPGFSGNGATDSVFILDAGSGRMAVLKNVRKRGGMRLDGSGQNLFSHLPESDGRPRVLAAAPKVGASGTTNGAWVFDSASGEVLFLENIRGSHDLRIHRVIQQTR